MTQLDRLAYLEAMGVDVWVQRQNRVSTQLPAIATTQPQVGEAESSPAAEPSTPVATADPTAATASARVAPDSAIPTDMDQVDRAAPQEPTQSPSASIEQSPPEQLTPQVRDGDAIAQFNDSFTEPPQQPVEPDVDASINPATDARSSQIPVTLESLQIEAAACTRCELHSTRLQSVFGHGNPDADWMFVGEAPGAEEDRQGLPFVGPAGKLLDAMLLAIGLEREDVYIANLVKCRPPRNRDPQTQELASCESYIRGQLEIIQPRIIVALGRFAAQSLTQSTESIGRLRGSQHTHALTGIPVVATYHPAYLLRSPVEKGKVWRDLLRARAIVANGG